MEPFHPLKPQMHLTPPTGYQVQLTMGGTQLVKKGRTVWAGGTSCFASAKDNGRLIAMSEHQQLRVKCIRAVHAIRFISIPLFAD